MWKENVERVHSGVTQQLKKNEIMKFAGIWIELGKYLPEWGIPDPEIKIYMVYIWLYVDISS